MRLHTISSHAYSFLFTPHHFPADPLGTKRSPALLTGHSSPVYLSAVPSIATEFLRKRSTHDQTARQWTETYAKPTPPPSPPSNVPSNPPSSSTVTTGTTSVTTNRTSAKGKGRASAQSAGPEGAAEQQATTGVDLTGDGIEAVSLPTRGTKRRREVHASDSVIDLSEEVEASSTRGGKRRHVEMLGDVIVIED